MPNHLKGGGSEGGGGGCQTPHPPGDAELLSKTLGGGGAQRQTNLQVRSDMSSGHTRAVDRGAALGVGVQRPQSRLLPHDLHRLLSTHPALGPPTISDETRVAAGWGGRRRCEGNGCKQSTHPTRPGDQTGCRVGHLGVDDRKQRRNGGGGAAIEAEGVCGWVLPGVHTYKFFGGGSADALEGKGPQRRPQRRLDGRLEEVDKAVGGGYCRLQIPLELVLAVRGTVAGHRLGRPGRGVGGTPPLPMHPSGAGGGGPRGVEAHLG